MLVHFPHTDLEGSKRRPALVLSPAAYNHEARDVVLAFVTSRRQTNAWAVPIDDTVLSTGRLVKASWIRSDRIASIEKRLIDRAVATLAAGALRQVRDRIERLLVRP